LTPAATGDTGRKWAVNGEEPGVVSANEVGDELRDGRVCSAVSELEADWRRRNGKEKEGSR